VEGALQDFNEAIRLRPDFAGAFYNRGNARAVKGDVEGALQDYNEAIRLGYRSNK
jgi:tetratricopeptide (TPR) repeat protein